eukprot:359018-Chlamydomonas_euryale.AAC.6
MSDATRHATALFSVKFVWLLATSALASASDPASATMSLGANSARVTGAPVDSSSSSPSGTLMPRVGCPSGPLKRRSTGPDAPTAATDPSSQNTGREKLTQPAARARPPAERQVSWASGKWLMAHGMPAHHKSAASVR